MKNASGCVGCVGMKTLKPMLPLLDTSIAKPAAKGTDPHYGSAQHKQWREAIVARAGGRCEWPGCGRAELRMFADHIVEIADGGSRLDLANGQCLCGRHHTIKTIEARRQRHN